MLPDKKTTHKNGIHLFSVALCMLVWHGATLAQEETESAETSFEANADSYQECFFEALKESAIENYEKAIDRLMGCKQLDTTDEVLDYELGKNYAALKQYPQAEQYLKRAVAKNPGNRWYLDALFGAYQAQGKEQKAIELAQQLAQKHPVYKETLVALYAQNQQYQKALELLAELERSSGTNEKRKNQRLRYTALMNLPPADTVASAPPKNRDNPLSEIRQTIETYQKNGDYKSLSTYMDGILEMYPAQAPFYYAKGKALIQLNQPAQAISFLETALDFLADDAALENHLYRELQAAYTAIGNTQKAEQYRRKIKNSP